MSNQEIINIVRDIRKAKKVTQKELAEILGVDKSQYSKIERGKSLLNWDKLQKITEFLGTSLEEISRDYGQNSIKFVNSNVEAGFLGGELIEEIHDFVPFSLPNFEEKDLVSITVKGDSMLPTFESGDLLIIKKLEGLDFATFGKTYVFVNQSEQLVKRLIKHKKSELIILQSDNGGFQQTLDKTEIRSIWEIKGIIRKF